MNTEGKQIYFLSKVLVSFAVRDLQAPFNKPFSWSRSDPAKQLFFGSIDLPQFRSPVVDKYLKIPKISPGAYIFLRAFLRGLYTEGILRFKIG